MQQQVGTAPGPLRLLALGEALADHRVDRALGHRRRDALARPEPLAVVDEAAGVRRDVDGKLLRRRVEFITRGDRRRVWAVEQKRAIALESMDPEGAPSDVARRYGISSGLLYTWRRQMMEGQLGSAPQHVAGFARVDLMAEVPRLAAPEPVQPVPDPQPPVPPLPPPCAGVIEIGLPGGVSVRVDASVDGVALRRVLDALEGR